MEVKNKMDIVEEFEDILRNKLSDKAFVEFVMDWFDPDVLCELIVDSFTNMEEETQDENLELIKKYQREEK
jgi:hypothetical protein